MNPVPDAVERRSGPSESTAPEARAPSILRRELQRVSDAYRERHPLLAHQDAIGITIFALSCSAIVGAGWAYGLGALPAYVVMFASAFFMSLLHEIEHDLIHRLYFRNNKLVYNLMMAGVWLFRPSTINPWTRRDLHLHHHRVSGTESDLEERGITNGERWGVRRLLMTVDSMLAIYLRLPTIKSMVWSYIRAQKPANRSEQRKLLWRNRLSYFPLGLVHYTLWHAWLFFQAYRLVLGLRGLNTALPPAMLEVLQVVDFLVIVWLLPNVVRTFCLHFVSSNMHYYGDIDPRNTAQQTQVWTSLWFAPLQLFCFNFGGTHAIHHFVVQEPFYLRQLVAKESQRLMRAHGVRFNDFGTFLRANRWHLAQETSDVRSEESPNLHGKIFRQP